MSAHAYIHTQLYLKKKLSSELVVPSNLTGACSYSQDVTTKLGHILVSGTGMLKCGLSDRVERGG